MEVVFDVELVVMVVAQLGGVTPSHIVSFFMHI
jgi:hypothetical protein